MSAMTSDASSTIASAAMTSDPLASQLRRLLLQQEIDQINADYAAALDEKRARIKLGCVLREDA